MDEEFEGFPLFILNKCSIYSRDQCIWGKFKITINESDKIHIFPVLIYVRNKNSFISCIKSKEKVAKIVKNYFNPKMANFCSISQKTSYENNSAYYLDNDDLNLEYVYDFLKSQKISFLCNQREPTFKDNFLKFEEKFTIYDRNDANVQLGYFQEKYFSQDFYADQIATFQVYLNYYYHKEPSKLLYYENDVNLKNTKLRLERELWAKTREPKGVIKNRYCAVVGVDSPSLIKIRDENRLIPFSVEEGKKYIIKTSSYGPVQFIVGNPNNNVIPMYIDSSSVGSSSYCDCFETHTDIAYILPLISGKLYIIHKACSEFEIEIDTLDSI